MCLIKRVQEVRCCKFSLSDIIFLDNGWSHDYPETSDFIVHFYGFMLNMYFFIEFEHCVI